MDDRAIIFSSFARPQLRVACIAIPYLRRAPTITTLFLGDNEMYGSVPGAFRRAAYPFLGGHPPVVLIVPAPNPPGRKPVKGARAIVGPLIGFIDAILEANCSAPRKQRHTMNRIWQRILTELPERKAAEVSVRRYLHARNRSWAGRRARSACRRTTARAGRPGRLV
jgi:hypothetical protein